MKDLMLYKKNELYHSQEHNYHKSIFLDLSSGSIQKNESQFI